MTHIALIYLKKDLPYAHIILFDTPSLMILKPDYGAFDMSIDMKYRLNIYGI